MSLPAPCCRQLKPCIRHFACYFWWPAITIYDHITFISPMSFLFAIGDTETGLFNIRNCTFPCLVSMFSLEINHHLLYLTFGTMKCVSSGRVYIYKISYHILPIFSFFLSFKCTIDITAFSPRTIYGTSATMSPQDVDFPRHYKRLKGTMFFV